MLLDDLGNFWQKIIIVVLIFSEALLLIALLNVRINVLLTAHGNQYLVNVKVQANLLI